MANDHVEFRRVRIAPMDCIETSWRLVKDQYWLFLGMSLLTMLIGGAAPLGILLGPMMCGLHMCYLKKMRGETVEFDLLFKGFDHFVESLIATLIMFAVIIVGMIPVYALLGGGFVALVMTAKHGQQPTLPPIVLVLALLLCLVAGLFVIVLSVLFTFSYMLIVDKGLTGAAAAKTSAKAAWANVWGLVGLALLSWLLSMLGAMCCYVGLFFVLPLTLGAPVVAYRKVFPAEPPAVVPPPPAESHGETR